MKTFYSDMHLFGFSPVNIGIDFDEHTYLLGDIVDLKNCSLDKIEEAKRMIQSLKDIFKERYISGNHELGFWNLDYVQDGILLTHGDYLMWGESSAISFRNKKEGRNFLSRFISLDWVSFGKSAKRSFLKKASKLAKQKNCHTIVVGHKHPKCLIKEEYEDTHIYILPKGKTFLNI